MSGPLANGGLTPAELAQPTPADIAGRLAVDARGLAKRLDDFCGPVDEQLRHELAMLIGAARDLAG